MSNLVRNSIFVIATAAVLAGCQTTEPRLCDFRKPGDLRLYQGSCCDASVPGSPCISDNEGRPNERPNPRAQ